VNELGIGSPFLEKYFEVKGMLSSLTPMFNYPHAFF
jgi:hypothetical protein